MPNTPDRKPEIAASSDEADIFALATQYCDRTLAEMNQLLALWGMTALQYNALKVIYIHDTEGTGLPGSEIGRHLTTRVPDVTRLLDRLSDRGWLIRERDKENRRVVRTRLTDIGVELVETAHTSLKKLEKSSLAYISDTDKKNLKQLLSMVTANDDSSS